MIKEQIQNQLAEIKSLIKKGDDHAYRQTSKPLSFKEAAAYLGFKPSYLYKLTHRKLIKCYKPLGKMLFFSKGELDEWVFGKSQVKSGKLKEGEEESEVRSKNDEEQEDEEPP